MDWLNVTSLDELKEVSKVNGKSNFNNIKKMIKKDITNYIENHGYKEKASLKMITVTGNSWSGLYDKICIFRDIINTFSQSSNDNLNSNKMNNGYFKSNEDELIFYILEMDGKRRSDKLGITRKCFMDKSEARKWKNDILKIIHPDKLKHPMANEAVSEINQLYKEMVDDE